MVKRNEAKARYRTLWKRKKILYRGLFDFTFGQCGFCVQSGCACKDRICQHVEEQAGKRGFKLERVKSPKTPLRFIGDKGCVVEPHLRETCTIYLCEKAQGKPGFDSHRYSRLKDLCQINDWEILELEEEFGVEHFAGLRV